MCTHNRKPEWRRVAPVALAVLGGVLLFLGWAGFGYWPLELVALVPFFTALEQVRARSRWVALAIGWLFGTVGIAGGYHWMLEFTQLFSGFGRTASALIFVLFSLALGLQFGVQALLYVLLRRRGRSVAVSALPSLIVTEWLFPTLFPVYLGTSLIDQPLLIQTADLGGPLLVSLSIGVANVVVFETLRWRLGQRRAPHALLVTAALFIGSTMAYGEARIRDLAARMSSAPPLEVGLVQVNMGVFEKQQQMLEAHRRYLGQSAELESEGPLDLLVWPESAYNYPRFDRTLPMLANEVRQDLDSTILFGGLSVTRERGRRELYNSVFLLERDGLIGQRYDKTRLAMFGEYLPFGDRFPRLYLRSPNTGMFTPGKDLNTLSLGPWRVSTPVCYEAILPSLIREMVREGDPHLIVNLSNDAWFGDTQGPEIHLNLARLRAVEHRRYLVRSTNSGVSAIVDPVGAVRERTDVGTRANLRASVRLLDGQTVYARFGDWPGWLSLFVVAFALARPPERTGDVSTERPR